MRVRPFPFSELPRILKVQLELSRILLDHLAGVLDALQGSDGMSQLLEVCAGRLGVSQLEPYLSGVKDAPLRFQGARIFLMELLAPAPRRLVLCVDETLVERLGRSDRELLAVMRHALASAPLRVLDVVQPEEAAALLSEEGEKLLCMDAFAETGQGSGWLRLCASAHLRLGAPPPLGLGALRSLWQRRHLLADVKVSLRLEAGYGVLSAREVADLAPGDIVVLDRFGPRPVTGGSVWLRLGNGAFTCYIDGDGVTVLGPFHLRGLMMVEEKRDNAPTRPERADGPSDESERVLRELPVQLVCEIGRVVISGKELLELRPGVVLAVGRPLTGPVDLTSAGRVIARGELVDVEGEIGVRVTEVEDAR